MEFTGYLDFWFQQYPIVERVEKFAALGIRRLDVWLWRERPLAEIYAACKQVGSCINSTFDPLLGNLVDKQDHPRCLDSWAESLEIADKYEIPHLFVFSNQVDLHADGQEWIAPLTRDYTPGEMYANLLDGLALILEMAEKKGITLWFEALNTFHIHGGVFIHTHDQAADIVRRLNHPRLRLSFDCYHQQRTAGNLIYGLETYHGLYPTVHIGDVPTRQEPGTGEINFPNIARTLKKLHFDGFVGLEFTPSTTEAEAWQKVQQIFAFQV